MAVPSGAFSPASGGAKFDFGRYLRGLPKHNPLPVDKMQAAGPGAGGASGGPLGTSVDQSYQDIIAKGGSPYTSEQKSYLVNSQMDTVNRGTNSALDAARMDAIRRGDTSGSTLGSREDTIRAQGAANASGARLATETALSSQAMQNLLAALGGAGGRLSDIASNDNARRQLEILVGQMEAQRNPWGGGAGGAGLNILLGA